MLQLGHVVNRVPQLGEPPRGDGLVGEPQAVYDYPDLDPGPIVAEAVHDLREREAVVERGPHHVPEHDGVVPELVVGQLGEEEPLPSGFEEAVESGEEFLDLTHADGLIFHAVSQEADVVADLRQIPHAEAVDEGDAPPVQGRPDGVRDGRGCLENNSVVAGASSIDEVHRVLGQLTVVAHLADLGDVVGPVIVEDLDQVAVEGNEVLVQVVEKIDSDDSSPLVPEDLGEVAGVVEA